MNMKHSSTLLGAALGFALLSAPAHAAVVLIDGTSPDYTRNGSFETNDFWQGSGSTLAGDLGIGGSGGLAYRTNASGISDGSRYIVVEQRGFGAFQDTGHTLSLSETFNLSFFHGLHQSSSASQGDATIDWQLFTSTTNDNTGTVDQVIASGSVLGNETTTPIEVSLSSIGTVASGAVGDNLFISITSSYGASGTTSLYSVDEVNLTAVPEPSAAALIALAGLGLLMRRRR